MDDPNPERRNLMLVSLAFIAYCFGGGEVAKQELQLQIINIKFEELWFLQAKVWSIYFWFLLRYWQHNRGKFHPEFISDLASRVRQGHPLFYLVYKLLVLRKSVFTESANRMAAQGKDGFTFQYG